MKFVCSQASLSKALNTVSRAVSIRTTVPILKGILFNVKESRLTLSASDLDISIETSLDVQNSENGSCVVNAKLIGEIIRKLPNALINVSLEDNNLKINCFGSEFSLITQNSDEFPVIKGVDNNNFYNFNKNDFNDLIRKTSFAASVDEKKGILTGTLINIESDKMEMVALDGFRMAVANKSIENGNPKKVIVPAKILNEVVKILSEEDSCEEISLIADEKKIEIRTEDTVVVARLLEGDFIKYNDIIPVSFKTKIIVNRLDVLSGLERASLLAKDREGKNNLIKMIIESNSLDITSSSEEGNVNEHVSCDFEGDDITIGFNSKYLIDILKSVEDEEVSFEMGTNTSACIIKPVEGKKFIYLVLPVRISVS